MRSYILVALWFFSVPADCFFGWLDTKPQPVPATEAKDFNKDGTAAVVPFEMKTADDAFLNEGKKYGLQMSSLDVCHHKVLLGLKSSCSQLSEEELGKLSVRLLNCQSAVEGRSTYPCSDEMSLRECTRGMDQHTWNTYHLISNRARAVCYSTRQQQFHAKTEMTVNKLVWTTDQQVKAMSQLEQEQQKVSTLTTQTLETMSSGQKALMQQQEKLKSSQQSVQSFVAENLKQLMLEKALIAAGQKELADMTNAIRKKLDSASTMMLTNEQQRQVNHRELLKDLNAVQDNAKFLQEKLDQSAQEVLARQEKTAVRFEETLDNLAKINASIAYLQRVIETTRKDVDAKFGWLANLLHGTGDQLTAIYCCVLHCGYLLVAMFLAAFLHIRMSSRMFLIFIVPINAVAEIQEGCSLGFGPLSILLSIFVAGDTAWHAFREMYNRRRARLQAISATSQQPTPATNVFPETVNDRQTSFRDKVWKPECDPASGDSCFSVPAETSLGGRKRRPSWTKRSHTAVPRPQTLPEEAPSTPLGSDSELGENDTANVSRWLTEHVGGGCFPDVVPSTSTPVTSPKPLLLRGADKDFDVVKRDLLTFLDQQSPGSFSGFPATSLCSNRSTSSNQSRRLCSGLNKSGVPCKATCLKGKDFCHHHT